MNKLKLTIALTTIAIATLTVTGCKPEDNSVSVQERMEMFIEDANAGDYGSLKEHTHPSATKYNLANYTYWYVTFFVNGTELPLGSLSVSGNTATAEGSGTTFTFTLLEDGEDVYKIRTITRTGGGESFN